MGIRKLFRRDIGKSSDRKERIGIRNRKREMGKKKKWRKE